MVKFQFFFITIAMRKRPIKKVFVTIAMRKRAMLLRMTSPWSLHRRDIDILYYYNIVCWRTGIVNIYYLSRKLCWFFYFTLFINNLNGIRLDRRVLPSIYSTFLHTKVYFLYNKNDLEIVSSFFKTKRYGGRGGNKEIPTIAA